ncbi:YdcF family protein [Candidatus Latescibacterota bacterium]
MLGSETIKRLDNAAELFNTGRTKHILCVGGKGLEKRLGITGSQMMREYLAKAGVPEEKVTAGTSSYDSYSNWEEARTIIHAHYWKTITLVSSPFHLYRLSYVAKDENLRVSFSPYSVDCPDSLMDLYSMREWIHHEWKAFAAQKFFPEPLYRGLLGVIRR